MSDIIFPLSSRVEFYPRNKIQFQLSSVSSSSSFIMQRFLEKTNPKITKFSIYDSFENLDLLSWSENFNSLKERKKKKFIGNSGEEYQDVVISEN